VKTLYVHTTEHKLVQHRWRSHASLWLVYNVAGMNHAVRFRHSPNALPAGDRPTCSVPVIIFNSGINTRALAQLCVLSKGLHFKQLNILVYVQVKCEWTLGLLL
jgi:hypothetical protein